MRGSFGPGYLEQTTVPMSTVRSIGLLGEYKGKQRLFEKQSPQALSALREVARVQSIESSNRIEGVTAASGRVAELAAEKSAPRDRSEQEIAGYRDVLSTVHANALGMDVSTALYCSFIGTSTSSLPPRAAPGRARPTTSSTSCPTVRAA